MKTPVYLEQIGRISHDEVDKLFDLANAVVADTHSQKLTRENSKMLTKLIFNKAQQGIRQIRPRSS